MYKMKVSLGAGVFFTWKASNDFSEIVKACAEYARQCAEGALYIEMPDGAHFCERHAVPKKSFTEWLKMPHVRVRGYGHFKTLHLSQQAELMAEYVNTYLNGVYYEWIGGLA